MDLLVKNIGFYIHLEEKVNNPGGLINRLLDDFLFAVLMFTPRTSLLTNKDRFYTDFFLAFLSFD